jgi:hypothetical protein
MIILNFTSEKYFLLVKMLYGAFLIPNFILSFILQILLSIDGFIGYGNVVILSIILSNILIIHLSGIIFRELFRNFNFYNKIDDLCDSKFSYLIILVSLILVIVYMFLTVDLLKGFFRSGF